MTKKSNESSKKTERQFYETYYKKVAANEYLNETSRILPEYHQYFGQYREKYHELLKSIICREHTILDIGCGDGADLTQFTDCKIAVGIDVSHNALKTARENRKSNAQYALSDAFMLPFADSLFDVIMCSEVIEHFDEPEKCIKEIRRLLKPGGYAVITTPNVIEPCTLLARSFLPQKARFWIYKMTGQGNTAITDTQCQIGDFDSHKYKINTMWSLRKAFQAEGLTLDFLENFSLRCPLAFLIQKNKILLSGWKLLDRIISILPFSQHLHWHMVACFKKI